MDFDKYKNTMAWPRLPDYREITVYDQKGTIDTIKCGDEPFDIERMKNVCVKTGVLNNSTSLGMDHSFKGYIKLLRDAGYGVIINENREAYQVDRNKYDDHERELHVAFRRDLYDEHGEGLPEKLLDVVYAKAWSDGHANGFSEVCSCFGNLVDFTKEILKASGNE